MKVDPLGQLRTAPLRRRAGTGGDGSFARALQGAGQAAVGGGPIGSIDALLSLQEVGDSTSGGSGAEQRQRHGQDLLDRLEELRLALLDGRVTTALLRRIDEALALRPPPGSDPRLEALLDEIELRAAVEAAKLERSAAMR